MRKHEQTKAIRKAFSILAFRFIVENVNKELFIASRILKGASSSNSKLSKPIVLVSVTGIVVSMVVMILAIAIVTGFQSEIRDKVIGFGSHIQINSYSKYNSYESSPIGIQQSFYPSLKDEEGVSNIQIYATKPGIIQTESDIQGIIAKGVGTDFDWTFFEDKIKAGKCPTFIAGEINDSILISKYLTQKLSLSLNDTLITVFIPATGKPKQREFIIGGIYETGLEDIDHQLLITDIQRIQEVNNWGVAAFLQVLPYCENQQMAIQASAKGKYGNFHYSWIGSDWQGPGPHFICPTKDTTLQVVVHDIPNDMDAPASIPDTAWVSIRFLRDKANPEDCRCEETDFEEIRRTSGGSGKYYVGGFEVLLDNYGELKNMDNLIRTHIGPELETETIVEQFEEIFVWLGMIDMNVYILILLMIAVSVINMTSALLILILEKTSMVGIFKSMGVTNWQIRKIFLYNAFYLIRRGLLWGNIIGVSLCLIQEYFKVIKLPQENYYISEVPINLQWEHLLLLNGCTVVVVLLALLVPSYLITRISAIKAIRFN